MVILRVSNFCFDPSFDFFFFEPHCLFFIKYFRGIFVLQLPSFFFLTESLILFALAAKVALKVF